ncbi:MAG: hypothetical protein AAGL66_02180 [Pseudomonadota bacterium]
MADNELDLKNLVDGVVRVLGDHVAAPPWRLKRETGAWPVKRSGELEMLYQRLGDERAASEAKVDGTYSERRKDIGKIVDERGRRIDAYTGRTRQVIAADDNKFIVAGRITDQETGVGLPNVRVKAFDLDRQQNDKLGNARTDSLGYFRIEYTEADFMDAGEESQPETFIEVLGDDDEIIHTSRQSFVQKAGDVEFVKVELDGAAMEKNFNAGLRIDSSIKKRVDGLRLRKRLLTVGTTGVVGKLPVRKSTTAGSTRKKAPASQKKSSAEGAAANTKAKLTRGSSADPKTDTSSRNSTSSRAKTKAPTKTRAKARSKSETKKKVQTRAKAKQPAASKGKSGSKAPPKTAASKRPATRKGSTRKPPS